jgi:hypothetical protein
MASDDICISGELLGSARGSVRHFPAGRTCEEPGCDTVLSIYNARSRCARHDFDESLLHFRTVPTTPQQRRRATAPQPHAPVHPHAA